jgi:hypothetical protein
LKEGGIPPQDRNCMRCAGALAALAISTLVGWSATGAPGITVTPKEIVLQKEQQVELVVKGLPGTGAVRAAVNVGKVTRVETLGADVHLHYRSPEQLLPQRLVVLLWREGSGQSGGVARIPLLAHADISVKTRASSQVTVEVAGKTFGPKPSGRRGRVTIRALVPPGVTQGWAEAVDAVGLRNKKRVTIDVAPYNPLALGVERTEGRYNVMLAASEDLPDTPRVEILHGEASPLSLPVRQIGPSRWDSSWSPGEDTPPGTWTIRAQIPGAAQSDRGVEVDITLAPDVAAAPRSDRRLGWNVSLATGVMHNTMDLVSARFTLEGGADYPLGPGRIGGRLVVGVAWDSQEVPVAPGLSPVSSSVVMIPLGAVVTYRLAYGPWAPYLVCGPLLMLVQVSSEGEHTGTRQSLIAAPGFLGLLGTRYRLGPGGIFAQAGYQHSSVDNRDTELLAGGIVVELGYRLEL